MSELDNKFLVIKIFRSQLLGQDILAARTRQLSLPSFLIRGKECFLFSTLYCLNSFTLQANLFTYTTFLYLILFFYLIPHHRNKKSQLQTCTHISNNIHIYPTTYTFLLWIYMYFQNDQFPHHALWTPHVLIIAY